jgi:hypothetical protein
VHVVFFLFLGLCLEWSIGFWSFLLCYNFHTQTGFLYSMLSSKLVYLCHKLSGFCLLLLKIIWVFNLILSGGNFVLQVVPQADRVLIRLEQLPEVCLLFHCLCFVM